MQNDRKKQSKTDKEGDRCVCVRPRMLILLLPALRQWRTKVTEVTGQTSIPQNILC